jgi:pimeloyl-ACP methyl ester carboxylesterase
MTRLLRRGGGATLLAAAGWLGYSKFAVSHDLSLPPALPGDRRELIGGAGKLNYYVAGAGAPLLLVHSVNAAASAYEVRPLFEHMQRAHRVYALDLPGFGGSARGPRHYYMGLFVDALHDMLAAIALEHGDQPVDALALSLGAEFLARAATEAPERFRSLALVNPTGFEDRHRLRGKRAKATREIPGLRAALEFPLWGQALFDLLVSKPSIRYFLEKTWGSKAIDEGLAAYAYLTAHQPGARHAPFTFVSGALFSTDIRRVYERLALPVWMPHGTRGDFNDFRGAQWVRERPNWTVEPLATGAMPHFESTGQFVQKYSRFLSMAAEESRGMRTCDILESLEQETQS